MFTVAFFLVPKTTEDLRPVIDLSSLNLHLVIPRFRMETAQAVRSAIQPLQWTISIDINDAYLHVPLTPAAGRYLRFQVIKQTFQFNCLPFGLATSPREFTMLLRPVLRLLRLDGIKVHVYRDDCLILRSESASQDRADYSKAKSSRTGTTKVDQPSYGNSPSAYQSRHEGVTTFGMDHQYGQVRIDTSACIPVHRHVHRHTTFTVVPLDKVRLKVLHILQHWRD